MSIILVPYTIERTEYDESGSIIHEKGDVVLSHGVDTNTFENIAMSQEPFHKFVNMYGFWFEGEAYLK